MNLPMWIARILAWGFDMLQAITLGLIPNPVVTRDQVKNLGPTTMWSRTAQ